MVLFKKNFKNKSKSCYMKRDAREPMTWQHPIGRFLDKRRKKTQEKKNTISRIKKTKALSLFLSLPAMAMAIWFDFLRRLRQTATIEGRIEWLGRE
ncbi:unnamed protein product [Arabidopsis halleri]